MSIVLAATRVLIHVQTILNLANAQFEARLGRSSAIPDQSIEIWDTVRIILRFALFFQLTMVQAGFEDFDCDNGQSQLLFNTITENIIDEVR